MRPLDHLRDLDLVVADKMKFAKNARFCVLLSYGDVHVTNFTYYMID